MRGRSPKVPSYMFTLKDLSEYLGIHIRDIREGAVALGLVHKLPGRDVYGPMDRQAAKALIQHFRLRSARLLMRNGVLKSLSEK